MVACTTIQGTGTCTDIPASTLLLPGGNSCHWQVGLHQVRNLGNGKKSMPQDVLHPSLEMVLMHLFRTSYIYTNSSASWH